ncbi:nitrate reductase associated protein [Microcoleus sp. FACHB-1515]|uniref:nitrate reductase associated protein n=1 Tax=Cyanophyceae TaxID=3028117 RepID=UPI0016824643|nr:nitrate reductase associated protein [Microcoleus sp. FACHB-1515]
MTAVTFFQFEQDFVDSLRCIPMQVRYKLDTCGVKLKLSHWSHFTEAERQAIVNAPCETDSEIEDYRNLVQQFVTQHMGTPAGTLAIDPHPAWLNGNSVPAEVQEKAIEFGVAIDLPRWNALTPLQRFVLIKLSRPGHENKNFQPALTEFHLV